MFPRMLLALFIAAGIAGTAHSPAAQQPPGPAPSEAPVKPPAAPTPSPAATPAPAPTEDSLREFVPREKVGAESAVAFPVDI